MKEQIYDRLAEPVTLCLINHNGLAYLQEALAAVEKLPFSFDEILVIDNASSDGSLAYLETRKEISVVALSSNTGPGGARNAGFLQAGNDIILFQDNDISLTEGVAQILYAALQQDPEILITLPRVLYQSDPATIQFEGADCHFLGMMSLRLANVKAARASVATMQTSSLVTACFMIDRRRWHSRQQGQHLFDETLIFNLEDHDLGVRVNLLGYKIMAVPAATVLHGSGTPGLSYRPGENVSATRMYCLVRNRWWVIFRYFSLHTLIVLAPSLFIFEILQLAGLGFKGWGRQWWRAFVDTLRHFPVLYRERKIYQQQRQRADRDILRDGDLPLTEAMNSNGVSRLGVKVFDDFMRLYWQLAKKLL